MLRITNSHFQLLKPQLDWLSVIDNTTYSIPLYFKRLNLNNCSVRNNQLSCLHHSHNKQSWLSRTWKENKAKANVRTEGEWEETKKYRALKPRFAWLSMHKANPQKINKPRSLAKGVWASAVAAAAAPNVLPQEEEKEGEREIENAENP